MTPAAPRADASQVDELEAGLLLEAIRARYGHDFLGYHRPTMMRRLALAKERFSCRSLSMLQDRVLHDRSILSELVGLLTVQVSEMFRDPGYYRALRETVLPHLATWPSLKVWVAGCAEGEELYSLAILFREAGLEARSIFYATDISPAALRKAEAGIYPLDRLQGFTESHHHAGGTSSLSDYYTAAYGAVAMDRTLRDRVVFSQHNLATDEVFAEVHLISCRNVLIYFDQELQSRAIRLFRDSLARGGFLGLGSSETIRFSGHADAFDQFNIAERIYRRRPADHVRVKGSKP